MDQLDIYQTGDGDACVVVLVGEVDMASAVELRRRLLECLSGESPLVIIELDRVTFLDSVGLNTLVILFKEAQSRDIQLRLAAPSRPANKVLDITHLNTYLPVYPTVDAAKAGFGGREVDER